MAKFYSHMNWDDDDNDPFNFNYDDLSPEEKEEINREIRENDKKRRNHPLFKKAKTIYETTVALAESLPAGHSEMYAETMRESAMMLAPKIAGAMGSGSWLLCMQNASLIRYHAEHLLTSTSGLKMFGEADKNYVKILRDEMLEFQGLFKEWVKSFENLEDDDFEDEWGLYVRK